MIAEEQKFQGKALSLSHTKTAITTIKEKFTEQQLQMFEQSCFGHLLGIEDLKWTSPIVHGLLIRKADPKTVSQLNGIKFIVGNKKRKYFANDKTVNLLELEKAFLECDDVDDVFKLGFVYFAVFVLFGNEKHVHIDMRYLKLAEDLEDFGKYPWGAVCYAKTNASLLRALCADYQRVKVPTKTAETKKSGKKPTTTATGRPREYHLKALAALHLVVHEGNAYIPRLLHWRSNSSPRFYELMSQVFENREVDVQLLRPSVMDKQQPYWTWGDSADNTEELAAVSKLHKLLESVTEAIAFDVGTGAGIFEVKKIGDEFFAFFVDCKEPKACTVLLRGPSKDLLNEMERNLQDAMSVARNILNNPKLVPGGGATELTVSATLKQKSSSVEAAAIALEAIPRTLALNCGVNVITTMTALHGKHANGENAWIGIDGNTGVITDVKEKKLLTKICNFLKVRKQKVDINYGTSQARLNEDEAVRVAYKHGTPLEGGKIADCQAVHLFSSAHNIPKDQAQAHHHLHDEDSNHDQSQMKQDELTRRE
ncbi:hypothetical protein L3X38_010590 [Prunus dulcis]|uniref:TCP-1/cpn60 chaperonin family protein n=1 Tax=Prunus dulcis TaxID=3755 RepID=A0AAD4ZEA5_PRUDU|nr:hypothetical protein L3X38_010590 [Prunus dulcis]